MTKVNRNEKCLCGSGKKYKLCCLQEIEAQRIKALSGIREACSIPSNEAVSISKAILAAIEYQQSGQFQMAEAIYDNVLKLEPNQPEALLAMGLIAQAKGDNDLVVELLEKCLEAAPHNIDYCIKIGSIYNSLNMPEKAHKCFKSIRALIAGTAQDHFNLGNSFNNLGELDEAISSYEQAIILNPNFAEAHYNLGTVHLKKNEFEKAIEHLQQASELKPNYSKAHNNLGYTFSKMGNINSAIIHYKKALSINPDFAQAHYNLGNAYKTQGLSDEALSCFKKAREIWPDMPELAHTFE